MQQVGVVGSFATSGQTTAPARSPANDRPFSSQLPTSNAPGGLSSKTSGAAGPANTAIWRLCEPPPPPPPGSGGSSSSAPSSTVNCRLPPMTFRFASAHFVAGTPCIAAQDAKSGGGGGVIGWRREMVSRIGVEGTAPPRDEFPQPRSEPAPPFLQPRTMQHQPTVQLCNAVTVCFRCEPIGGRRLDVHDMQPCAGQSYQRWSRARAARPPT